MSVTYCTVIETVVKAVMLLVWCQSDCQQIILLSVFPENWTQHENLWMRHSRAAAGPIVNSTLCVCLSVSLCVSLCALINFKSSNYHGRFCPFETQLSCTFVWCCCIASLPKTLLIVIQSYNTYCQLLDCNIQQWTEQIFFTYTSFIWGLIKMFNLLLAHLIYVTYCLTSISCHCFV